MEDKPHIKKLFHSLQNQLNLINSESYVNASNFLETDFKKLDDTGRQKLLQEISKSLDVIENNHKAAARVLEDIKGVISKESNDTTRVMPYIKEISRIVEETGAVNKEHMQKIQNYKIGGDFESFIRPILEKMTETDERIPKANEYIEKAKSALIQMNAYPR